MPEPITIREAEPREAEQLSALARRSKAHWGYPPELLALWRDDLRFTPEYIASHAVFVACHGEEIAGVVAVVLEDTTADIGHLWVEPDRIGSGVGRCLFVRAVDAAREAGAHVIVIESDPNAEAFYLRMGARRDGSVPSKPAGRELPRLVYEL
jgi:predicted N-acetyltransferase YhbS